MYRYPHVEGLFRHVEGLFRHVEGLFRHVECLCWRPCPRLRHPPALTTAPLTPLPHPPPHPWQSVAALAVPVAVVAVVAGACMWRRSA